MRVRRLEIEEVPETGEGVPGSDEGTAEMEELFTAVGAAGAAASREGKSLLGVVKGGAVGVARGLPAIYAR